MVLATAGVRRVEGAGTAPARNVGEAERLASIAAGGLLALYGLRRRGVIGMLMTAAAGELVRRGASGRCHLYDALGVSTADGHGPLPHKDVTSRAATVNARRAVKVERSVLVARTPSELYAMLRDFASLPSVMDSVRSVDASDSAHAHWVVSTPGGSTVEWTTELVNDVPDELIAWKTVGTPDVAHAGSVHFDPEGDATRVRVVVDYEPPAGGKLAHGAATGVGAAELIDQALARFRERAESGARSSA